MALAFNTDAVPNNTTPKAFGNAALHLHPQDLPVDRSVPRWNPAVPQFQPTGMDLALYAQPPTSLPPSHHALDELERYTLDTNIRHANDIARLDFYTHRNRAAIEHTNRLVQNDLQTLQGQVDQLRMQAHHQAHLQAPRELSVLSGPNLLELEICPPELMLQRFSREDTAEAFTEQAEAIEETARKLRLQIDELHGVTPEPVKQVKMLEQPKEAPTATLLTEEPTQERIREKELKAMIAANADNSVSTQAKTPPWQPLAVRQLPPPPSDMDIPNTNTITFTWEFLMKEFGGEQWSPGFYFIAVAPKIPCQTYWVLEREWEPFLPTAPGQHGAKLSPVFNDQEFEPGQGPDVINFKDVPLFVREDGSKEYTYYGQYSQPRYSDKLDYERVMETVPKKVRQRWADCLTDPARPEWVTKALMECFWPRPRFEGPLPTDSAIATPGEAVEVDSKASGAALEKHVLQALTAHAEELKAWEKASKIKVSLLTADAIMDAFTKADADLEPGMRLWWEYLQCVGYNQDFYDFLVQAQGIEQGQAKMRREMLMQQREVMAKMANVKVKVGGEYGVSRVVSSGSNSETVRPAPAPTPKLPPVPRQSQVKAQVAAASVVKVQVNGEKPVNDKAAPAKGASATQDSGSLPTAEPMADWESPRPAPVKPEPTPLEAWETTPDPVPVNEHGFPIVNHPYFDPVPETVATPKPAQKINARSSTPAAAKVDTPTAPKRDPPTAPRGDIEAAKKFQQQVTKAGDGNRKKGFGFGADQQYVPPHMRASRGSKKKGRQKGRGKKADRKVPASGVVPKADERDGGQLQKSPDLHKTKPASRKGKKHGRKALAFEKRA
ncbi:hypothetical protein LTR49_019614 [Elasticomyces elasticus]|nr:hypothetical protein LTR49_019614 [Elasticomyces elasticus]